MYTKLFALATLALSAVNAQTTTAAPAAAATGTFQFTETFPEANSIPTPKPEWLELIANANITNAPVLKAGSNGPNYSGTDNYCDWTFTGCTRPEDIVACPKGEWGITYDDGPTEFSPKLYDFLDQTGQKATFFLIGGQVVSFPQHAKRIFDAGHELAMHTWSHSYMTTLTNEQIVAELKWNELAIKQVTGYSPRFFRPPYGDIDDRVRDVAKALGFTPVIWNHDTNDWMAGEDTSFKPEWIEGNATAWAGEASSATVGGISLEHDLYQVTVDAAIKVLPILKGAYKVTTVGACVGQPSYKEGAAPVNGTSVAVPSATSSGVASAASGSAASGASGASNPKASESAAGQGTQEGGASQLAKASGMTIALVAAISMLFA